MNDIEVLIKHKNDYDIAFGTKIYRPYSMSVEDWEVIENLLKENKDLQKSVDQIYEDYQDIGKMYFNLTEKIEKKIEELKRQEKEELKGMKGQDRYFVKQMYQYKIQVLEELLKGE